MSVNYRLFKARGPTIADCLADCKSAIRYLRTHARELGIDPQKIVVLGDSAGGHLAAALGTIEGFDDPADDLSVSARPDAVVCYNPIVDFTDRAWIKFILGGAALDRSALPRALTPSQAQFELAQRLSPRFCVKAGQPPTLVMHGLADTVVSAEQSRQFASLMQRAGNRCDLVLLDGAQHAFVIARYTAPEERVVDAIRKTDAFLVSLGMLSDAPTLQVGPEPAWSSSPRGSGDDRPRPPATFCNPLSLPNYPIGRDARGVIKGELDEGGQWLLGHKEQFRELADVTALWFDGKWYLYPSVDMAWVSDDNGGTWQHRPLNVRDIGYAPTVVRHRGKFLLLASGSPLYTADSPLGPFTKLGNIQLTRTGKMSEFIDPMLFSDEDGRLYYYWGCSPSGGIWGMELNAKDPTKVLTEPAELIRFRPDLHPWEAVGEWNQNPQCGWIEGSWMLKRGGKYYLTYSAAGTENRTYAMGCYVGESPLGPFVPQKRNPILRTVDGLVTGTAHGCVVAGPEGKLWAFYTIRAGVVHAFERRLGMDRAEIDANGELVVQGASSLPQWLPGKSPAGTPSAATAWMPLNHGMRTIGSTSAPNLAGRFAVDNDLRTWWQPAEGDASPTLTSSFMTPASVHAVRIVWRDVGLDARHGVLPGPVRYQVELETGREKWATILDRGNSDEDLLIDYRECQPAVGSRVRLVILGWPKGIVPAVAEFTVFGKTHQGN